MADVSKTVAIIFQGSDETGPALSSIDRGLAGIEKSAAGSAAGVGALEAGVSRLSPAFQVLGSIAAGALSALSVGALIKEYTEANVELEKFARAMTSITGSTSAAGRELEYVRAVSERLGLDVRSTADAWVSLSAASKGTNLEGEKSRQIFEAVAGAMSLLGKSSADTQGALLAVQQIISKGTVSSEELRGQLGERLPGAFQIAARSVGVTTSELGKLLEAGKITADDFLPKFAAEIEKTFGNTAPVESYTASVNRLKNSWEQALQAIGQASGGLSTSVFEFATRDVQSFGTETSAAIDRARAFFNLMRGGSLETYNAELALVEKRLQAFRAANDGGNESLAETARLARQAAEAAQVNGDQTEAETARLLRQADAQAASLRDVGDAYKTLGINPDKVKKDVAEVISAFDLLARSPSVKGDQLLAGLEAALRRVQDQVSLFDLGESLSNAFKAGTISAAEFDRAMAMLDKRNAEIEKSSGTSSEAILREADALRKAEESASKMAIELEKIASNERIKLIEAKVTLDVARVEADAKKVVAAFESINSTVQSTGSVLGSLFGLFKDYSSLDWSAIRLIENQISEENDLRRGAFNMQKELTAAQIEVLKAQAANMRNGDALIKVDGSGLKPHLEAFMWEILKAIQVRVNNDGLKLLLGV